MFGNDLTCSPNTAIANIQPCNCAATATSSGAAEIVLAVCPICHGPRAQRGRPDIRRDVNIDTAGVGGEVDCARTRITPDGTPVRGKDMRPCPPRSVTPFQKLGSVAITSRLLNAIASRRPTDHYGRVRDGSPRYLKNSSAAAAASASPMPKPNLSAMSADALLKLRDDIEQALTRRAAQLRDELSRLGRHIGPKSKVGRSPLKGRKVPVRYRDRSGNIWAGRGAQPAWLREKLKAGAKLEDFAVHETAASRKASPKKRRRAKR